MKNVNVLCKLDAIVCNNKQQWNKNKCRCECKELIDKGICDKGFIWNPSNCECECECRKKLADKLIDECTETIEEVKLAEITLFENENNYRYNSCRIYIVLIIVVFTICIGITIYFVYYNWSLIKNNVSCIKFNTHKETKIW